MMGHFPIYGKKQDKKFEISEKFYQSFIEQKDSTLIAVRNLKDNLFEIDYISITTQDNITTKEVKICFKGCKKPFGYESVMIGKGPKDKIILVVVFTDFKTEVYEGNIQAVNETVTMKLKRIESFRFFRNERRTQRRNLIFNLEQKNVWEIQCLEGEGRKMLKKFSFELPEDKSSLLMINQNDR